MSSKLLRETAGLIDALAELPAVRKRLKDKPDKFHDAIVLEISAADFAGVETQGSSAYLHVPASIAAPILDAVDRAIRAELKRRGTTLPRHESLGGK